MKKPNNLRFGKIQDVRVSLGQPTEPGRLYYHYDAEIDKNILSLASAIPRSWSYEINIDNLILLDLDSERVLGMVDIMIPKRSWKVEAISVLPHATKAADLIFPEVTHRYEFIELPVQVMTDEARSYAYILIGLTEQESIWIELSEKCLALVAEDRLKGFFVVLN
jgi:hypothetical protein